MCGGMCACAEGESGCELEAAVWAGVWQEDASGLVGEGVAVAVFAVDEAVGSDAGVELYEGGEGAFWDESELRDCDLEGFSVFVARREQDARVDDFR